MNTNVTKDDLRLLYLRPTGTNDPIREPSPEDNVLQIILPQRTVQDVGNLVSFNKNKYPSYRWAKRSKRQAVTITQSVDGTTSTTFNITPLIYRLLFEIGGPIFTRILSVTTGINLSFLNG